MRKLVAVYIALLIFVGYGISGFPAAEGGVANETPTTTTPANTPTTTTTTSTTTTTTTNTTTTTTTNTTTTTTTTDQSAPRCCPEESTTETTTTTNTTTETPSTTTAETKTAPTAADSPDVEEFSISAAVLNETSTTVGRAVSVTIRVKNTGSLNRTYLSNLSVNGTEVANRSVVVAPGTTEVVTLEHRFKQPGVYAVAVDGIPLGRVTVSPRSGSATPVEAGDEAIDGVPSTPIVVVEATLPPDGLDEEAGTAQLQVVVKNTVDRPETRNLTVTIDGQPVATKRVRLTGNERAAIRIGFEPRNGTVAVEGVEAGRIRAGMAVDTGTASGDSGSVGLELVGLVVGVGVGALGTLLSMILLRNR